MNIKVRMGLQEGPEGNAGRNESKLHKIIHLYPSISLIIAKIYLLLPP